MEFGRLSCKDKDFHLYDGMSEREFKKVFAPHYQRIAPDKRDDAIKADYKELKKHFTKKKVDTEKES